jgi:uncharacterized protein YbaP (TraB family)
MRLRGSGLWNSASSLARLALLVLPLVSAGGEAPGPERAGAAPRHVFLWRISPANRSGATLYVLGSTHAGRKPRESVDPAIERAFAAADALVLEVDTSQTNSSEISNYAREIGKISDGTRLSDRIPQDLYQRVRRALERQRLAPDALDGDEPWLAALLLSGNALSQMGYNPNFGIEEYFLQRARNKRVVELEGARAQLQMLDGMSVELQTTLLEQTLDELQGLHQTVAAMYDSWEEGDAERMGSLVFSSLSDAPQTQALYERVYFARNRAMVSQLARSLEEGGVWFAVVGAGHMVGARGIPALFAARGYRVQQVAALSSASPTGLADEGTSVSAAILR